MTANQHHQQLASTQDRALTVGLVQKQIKAGMAPSDVAAALGSPNIVTGDNQKHETWIYDKISFDASFSQDNGSLMASVSGAKDPVNITSYNFPPPATFFGNANGTYSKSAGAASISQRTLTVIIKFTPENTVESVSYNSTRF